MKIDQETKITELVDQEFFGPDISGLLKSKGQIYFRNDSALASELKELRGEARMCFKNCLDLALAHPDQLTYVEGYAYASYPLPINHAWLITTDGQVVDPTWERGSNYFGIAFKNSELIKYLQITNTYGVIDSLWLHRELAEEIQSRS
jgi:hypothetical protein